MLSPAGHAGRLSILIFHRVLPRPDPLFPDEPHAATFDAICQWLAQWLHVLPLDEAVQRLRRGDLPARAAAITFDDGYADNHDIAAPILQRHGLTATFFVATGFLDGGRMWNDTVIEAIRRTPSPELALADLLPSAGGSPDVAPRVRVDDVASKRALIDQVLQRIKHLPTAQREQVVAGIAERAAAELPLDLMMTSQQVKGLRALGMGVGAHTISHPILAGLDEAASRREIGDGRDALAGLLGESIPLFAYPNGKPSQDYSPQCVALVRSLGFDAAVSTAWGAASASSDPFQLPRFTPWDRTRARFALRLALNLRAAQSPAAV